MGFLICFTGIDGSGKSTQAKMLYDNLKVSGIDCEYTWSRWSPVILRPFIKLARKSANKNSGQSCAQPKEEKNYSALKSIKKKVFKYKIVVLLYQYLALFDYYLQIRQKIGKPLKEGKIVICDRYIYDMCVDFALNFGYGEERFTNLLKLKGFSMFPKPGILFLLDIPPEIGAARKNDGTPVSYMSEGRFFYNTLTRRAGAEKLDGMLDKNILSQVILGRVKESLT